MVGFDYTILWLRKRFKNNARRNKEKFMNLSDLPCHKDIRGKIQMVLESCSIGSISIIDSEPNSLRANHMHLQDEHTILILEGQVEYYEKSYGVHDKPFKII